jgi:hypothetical protein
MTYRTVQSRRWFGGGFLPNHQHRPTFSEAQDAHNEAQIGVQQQEQTQSEKPEGDKA